MPRVAAIFFLLAACGTPSTDGPPWDGFQPPGERGDLGAYGSGSGGGPAGDMASGPPMCDEAARRCARELTYSPTGGEKALALMGDFSADGWTVGAPMTFDGAVWRVTVPIGWNAPLQYKFRITLLAGGEQWIPDPANPTQVNDGFGGKNSVLAGATCATWTCAQTAIACGPALSSTAFDWRDAVLYFVFVDRFVNGSAANDAPSTASGVAAAANWQGGDWAGVRQKIAAGYFQALGVNTLWLTVPMDNADATGVGDDGHLYTAYHGYWPRDLAQPEARFGAAAELTGLVSDAHAAGLKVILDYAMNHVHKDSPTYAAHMNDGWFNPLMVNGQACVCGTATCPWDSAAKTCWFRDYLPDFNFANAQARAFSVDNAMSWIKTYGVDGFRLDAVKHIETQWLLDLRTRLLAEVETPRMQHVYLVGETFTGDRNLIKSFIQPCQQLDGQFDFPLRAQVLGTLLMRQGKMGDLVAFMDGNASFYGQSVMSTFLGNHDVPRAIHFAADAPLWTDVWADGKDRAWTNQPATVAGTSAYERMGLAMGLLMTNRGAPLIYYGDEFGQPGAGDPDNRRMMTFTGYSTGQAWLLARTKALGAARAAHPALRRGERTTLFQDDESWAYRMIDGSDKVYVALNRSDSARAVSGLPSGALTDELTGATFTGPTVSVPARGTLVLK